MLFLLPLKIIIYPIEKENKITKRQIYSRNLLLLLKKSRTKGETIIEEMFEILLIISKNKLALLKKEHIKDIIELIKKTIFPRNKDSKKLSFISGNWVPTANQ